MTAVPVPALVAAITDELAEHRGMRLVGLKRFACNGRACDWTLHVPTGTGVDAYRAHVAERVAAAVVGLLPGLPPEDVAALIGGTVDRADDIWSQDAHAYVPNSRVIGPWVPVSPPAPAEPERGA